LRLGEAAAHHRALKQTTDPFQGTAQAALIHITGDDENASIGEAVRAEEGDAALDGVVPAPDGRRYGRFTVIEGGEE